MAYYSDPLESLHEGILPGYQPMATTQYQGYISEPYANPSDVVVAVNKKAKNKGKNQQQISVPFTQDQNQQVAEAGLGGLIPLLGGLFGASGMPAWLATLLGVGAAGYGVYQGLGGGEGGGLFGMNLLGDPATTIPGTNIILQGPGLAEPYPAMIVKEWVANGSQFYLLTDGRIAVYSKSKKRWKAYRPPKLAVIGKNMPSHRMLTRLRRNLKRHKDDARTVLKVVDPTGYAKSIGYRKYKRR